MALLISLAGMGMSCTFFNAQICPSSILLTLQTWEQSPSPSWANISKSLKDILDEVDQNFYQQPSHLRNDNQFEMDQELSEAELEEVYNWVDEVPLSRPKRNMARDFSDAQLFAEIIEHYNPKIIEMHNYVATGSLPVKLSNWKTLNRKVLPKIKLNLRGEDIESLANATPGIIQKLILRLKKAIEKGEIPSPSSVSKFSKSNTGMSFGLEQNKPKPYHKMAYHEIKKNKEVSKLVDGKSDEISLLKDSLGLLVLKAGKLEDILKSKDRQIEELVSMIKSKKLI